MSNRIAIYNALMAAKEIPEDELGDFQTLIDIVQRLRAPGGCPWDREQTHASLKRNLLEECYEVLEAIDREEAGPLAEELGDLLVQIAFHADIGREAVRHPAAHPEIAATSARAGDGVAELRAALAALAAPADIR